MKKYRHRYWIVLGGVLLALAVYWLEKRDTPPQEIAAQLPASDRHLLIREWAWVKSYDPYAGGQTTAADKQETRQLAFRADGRLIETTPDQTRQGFWLIDDDGKALALIFSAADQAPARQDLRSWDYRHHIRTLTQQELVLEWQGRHGYVVEWYKALAPSTASSK
ncbi:MAG: hypothetical protein OHK0039_01660 [Bacteroidia bacterium]